MRLTHFDDLLNVKIMTEIFKALADPTRRRVLELLKSGPKSAGELAGHFVVSGPTMSAHFRTLKEADLIHAERRGKQLVYHLKLSVLENALLGFADQFGFAAGTRAQPETASRQGVKSS